jgi:hypothetical protein
VVRPTPDQPDDELEVRLARTIPRDHPFAVDGSQLARSLGAPLEGDWSLRIEIEEDGEIGARLLAEPKHVVHDRHSRNGANGAYRGSDGGRPRKWSDDPRYQAKMEGAIREYIDEGRNDSEIADLVFADRKYYKRVARFRASL